MLPDYFPGLHPLVVHFPIALLLVAAAVDLGAVVTQHDGIRRAAGWLLLAGTAFLPFTYWSGRLASDRVENPFPRAQAVMAEHADLAWWTLWVFIALAVLRVGLVYRERLRGWLHAASAAALVAAVGLLALTADHGGQLVFDLGVGVRPVREAPVGAFEPEPELDVAALGPTLDGVGAWRWRFQPGAAGVLDRFLRPLEGELPAATVETQQAALVLTKDTEQRSVLTFGEPVDSASFKMRVRADAFHGAIALGLHAGGANTLDYLSWDGLMLTLGTRRAGADQVLARGELTASDGWHELELVAAGTHYRGYFDGELIVHGHGDAAPAGPAVIVLEGSGQVRLDDLRVVPIDE